MWRGGCMSWLFIGCNSMDFFTWGHLIILSLPGQSKDLMARLQAAVRVVDGNMLWHARMCCMAQCHLPWNGWRLLWPWGPYGWIIWHLVAICLWCVLKNYVLGCALCNIFDLASNRESHYGELMQEFIFNIFACKCMCLCVCVCGWVWDM